MERYCKLCLELAGKTVTLGSWRELITHVWRKHSLNASLGRWALKQQVKMRHKEYVQYWSATPARNFHYRGVPSMTFAEWEAWTYGDNLDPRKYDL